MKTKTKVELTIAGGCVFYLANRYLKYLEEREERRRKEKIMDAAMEALNGLGEREIRRQAEEVIESLRRQGYIY